MTNNQWVKVRIGALEEMLELEKLRYEIEPNAATEAVISQLEIRIEQLHTHLE